jgi:hypothetical protein
MLGKSGTLFETPCNAPIAPPNSTIVTDGTPTKLDSNILSASDVAKSLPRKFTQVSHDIVILSELLA